jgi:hypothetical protein
MSRRSNRTARRGKKPAVSCPTIAPEPHASTRPDSDQPVGLWRQDWMLSLLLVVVTMAAYLPAWHGRPIWDDDAHLTKPELRSLGGLVRIWTQPGKARCILTSKPSGKPRLKEIPMPGWPTTISVLCCSKRDNPMKLLRIFEGSWRSNPTPSMRRLKSWEAERFR